MPAFHAEGVQEPQNGLRFRSPDRSATPHHCGGGGHAYGVAKTPDSYKVTDITASGASLTRAQREEFSSAVQRSGGSVSNLIQWLRTKVTELATSAH